MTQSLSLSSTEQCALVRLSEMRGQELKYKFNSIKLLPLGEVPHGLGVHVRAPEKFRKSLFVKGIKLSCSKRELGLRVL